MNDEIYLSLESITAADEDRGLVPGRTYLIIRSADDEEVGYCDLRLGHNGKDGKYSTYYGGNIGYHIYEPYRGNRYAAKACKILIEQARNLGMEYLIITCSPENRASKRTIELAGFEFVETAVLPSHNDLYQRGERYKLIYRKNLKK